jgi:23S rRNA pseudouridine2605 synthase
VSDPEGRTTVRDLVGQVGERIFPVGRLDYHTSGVLLLTNDGDFCDALLHPRRLVPKTYVVKVAGEMKEADRKRWAEGVTIDGGQTAPAEVTTLRHERGKTWLEVTLFEGKNQQIRKMGEVTGFAVMRLSRTSFGEITSEGLRPGEYRALTVDELRRMKELFGVPKKVPRAQAHDDGMKAGERGQPRAVRTEHRRSPGGRTMSHRRPTGGGRRLTPRPPASTGKGGG